MRGGIEQVMSAKHVLVCWECGRPGRITEDNETHCEYCGPGVALVSVPDEETVYGMDCIGGRCEW
jgi:rRNA maturation endonuclease Nob1